MSSRTIESVDKVIQHAKLTPDHFFPVAQNLYFGSRLLDHTDIRLLEVSPKLCEVLSEGQSLIIRGDDDDSAILCTEDTTYDVKEAETSNSLLLLEKLTLPDKMNAVGNHRNVKVLQVEGIFHRYLELRECKPRLNKLRTILSNAIFSGPSSLENDGLLLTDLLHRVQCAEKQLLRGLKELRAVCVPSKTMWYLLDTDYHMRVLSFICNFVSSSSWSYTKVNKEETVKALQEIEPNYVIEQVFDFYFSPKENSSTDFEIHRDRLCRFFGEYLLQTGTTFDLQEFLSMWEQSMPETDNDAEGFFKPDVKHLRGLALVNTSTTPHTIRSFPEHVLPENIHERLEFLFRAQEKWSVDDIAPYVESLTTPILNVNALLTKFARAVNVSGKKFFCSKHGK